MKTRYLTALALCAAPAPALAGPTITFEEIDNYYRPAQFYNGGQAVYAGTRMPGGPNGPAQGLIFSGAAIVFERADTCGGCNGLFPTAPSGTTAMYNFPDSSSGRPLTVVDVPDGFTGSASVWHYGGPSGMRVWANAGGMDGFRPELLGGVEMPQTSGCTLTYDGATLTTDCRWTKYTITFDGTAHSLELYGGGSYFDDLTIGAAGEAGAVPETATWTMLIAGLGAIGAAMRRRPRGRLAAA